MVNKLTRRQFLRLGIAGTTTAVITGCQSRRRWELLEPFVRPPEEQLAGMPTWYASTCRQCPAGCGIIVRIMNGRALKIEGNPEHPLNQGKLCARGQAGLQVLCDPDRLTGPVAQHERNSGEFTTISWNEALNRLLQDLRAANGSVGIWLGSTTSDHLFTLFRSFAQGIGASPPLVYDAYSGMNGYNALESISQQLGAGAQLAIPDYSEADFLLSFGSDFLGAGLSAVYNGAAYGRFREGPFGRRGYLVQLEPRMSITGGVADRWIPIHPGSEGRVAQALMRLIADDPKADEARSSRAKTLAPDVAIADIASESGIEMAELQTLARTFASAESPLALVGAPVTGHSNALEAIAAIQSLNLIAGNLGVGVESPFPNQPAPSLRKPRVASYEQVQAFVDQMRSGQMKVLWVHGANPAYDLPKDSGFIEAAQHVPIILSCNSLVDETGLQADMILPDHSPLESWGAEYVSPQPGIPVIGGQQPVVGPLFDTRSTADVLLTIAGGLANLQQTLPWGDEVAFLKQIVTALGPGAFGGVSADVLWARFLQHGGWWHEGTLETVSKSPTEESPQQQISCPRFQGDANAHPFFLHLYLSNLLGDGRGASQPWLQGSPDPMTTACWSTWVEVNPKTAASLGITDGDVLRVASPYGQLEAPAYLYPAIRPDTVAIPIGQGHTALGRYATGRGASPIQLLGNQATEGGATLAWAGVRVNITPTGSHQQLALFENKSGVDQGFINAEPPG
jgi:anaerobic selenocysteine-containing dehydrogenase